MAAPLTTHITRSSLPLFGTHTRTTISTPSGPLAHRLSAIPYAVPLTAESRFLPPTPLPSLPSYPHDLTSACTECPQPGQLHSSKSHIRRGDDCLQLNIWIPADESCRPSQGWPVVVYIHGGFLQVGSPNGLEPSWVVAGKAWGEGSQCIVVSIGYRLNVFGFLGCVDEESGDVASANLGLWDQRCAIEWVANNIGGVDGDPRNISLVGISAGAYGVFHQLMYESYLPDNEAKIRRVVMWSNGCGLQPKSFTEVRPHFETLKRLLEIPEGVGANAALRTMRTMSTGKLIDTVSKCPANAFRAVTDGKFVRESFMKDITGGHLASVMHRRGMKILIGECADENNLYRLVSPPTSYQGLVQRMAVEFPSRAARRMAECYCSEGVLSMGYKTWQDLFGRVYADMQIHVTERGLLKALEGLSAQQALRYRIEWRMRCADKIFPNLPGATHGSDQMIWWWGSGMPVEEDEVGICSEWLKEMGAFVRGDEVRWGTDGIRQMKLLDREGRIGIIEDEAWDDQLRIWRAVNGVSESKL